MSSAIKDPEVPFVGRIDGGFEDGKIVRIQGYTAPVANRFNVNLQCDGSDDADIAVHISVRLQEGYVARNSFQGGEWGDEQDEGQLKIGTGEKFEILILSSSNDYKIAMNGQHFCEFPHRIAPSKITHLKIDGDVAISLISYEGGDLAKSASSQQNSQYGQQPNYGGYGPPQGGYGGYGGQGPQGYGPPPPGYQGYGQPGGYGAPPPPGYHPEQQSGLGDFLGTASEVIAGAIKSGMADKLIGQLTGGGNQNPQHQNPQQPPQYHPQQQPQQPSFNLPQMGGGGSIGGLGSMGSLLTGFAEQILNPKRPSHDPPTAGINLPSSPSAPSAPPILEDDKAPHLYPSINPTPGGLPGFSSYPQIPRSTPSIYPPSPNIPPNPGFQPPPVGGFPSAQNIGPYPRNPNPGSPIPSYPNPGNSYPGNPSPGDPTSNFPNPSNPQAGYPGGAPPSYYPRGSAGYPAQPGYPSQPGQPGQTYPTYPNNPGYPHYPGGNKYGNYQGGGAGRGSYGVGNNNSPVPAGYQVYKPDDFKVTQDTDSSAMDKVKRYGLPIIGAAVGTYALAKLTDNFGLGSDSDSD